MARIGIDARHLNPWIDGITRYGICLLRALSAIDRNNEYVIYKRPDFKFDFPEGWVVKDLSVGRFSVGEQLTDFPQILKKDGIDLLVGLREIIPLRLPSSCRSIAVIHDVMAFSFWWTYYRYNFLKKAAALFVANCLIRSSLKRCDAVITVSNFSKSEILRKVKLPVEKVNVIYPGVEERFAQVNPEKSREILSKYGISQPYFLFLGSFKPYKNVPRLLFGYRKLVDSIVNSPLLVLGGGDPYNMPQIKRLVKKLGLEKRVVVTGFVEDIEVPFLMQNALSFVFPSIYEGFGLPALEAMKAGVPVVASKIPPLAEITKGCAVYVNPFDEEDIYRGLKTVLENEELRKELVERGRVVASEYTWERTARAYLEIFDRVVRQ